MRVKGAGCGFFIFNFLFPGALEGEGRGETEKGEGRYEKGFSYL